MVINVDLAIPVTKLRKPSHYATHRLKERRNGAVLAPVTSVTLQELDATMMNAMEWCGTKERGKEHKFAV